MMILRVAHSSHYQLRTCTISLKKSITRISNRRRSTLFQAKLDHATGKATNYVADLASYTRAVIIDTVQKSFTFVSNDDDPIKVNKTIWFAKAINVHNCTRYQALSTFPTNFANIWSGNRFGRRLIF
jgi:hypothetical protein